MLLPGGALFREQNIILSAAGDDLMPRFHAPKLFMGAAAAGPHGVMQSDVILVAAQRRMIDRAERVVLLVDGSKFHSSSGAIVCGWEEIDVLITEAIEGELRRRIEAAGVEVIVAA